MTEDQKWQFMNVLMPPAYLAAIITRMADGTISRAGALIVFNTIYEQNRAKLAATIEEQA
jgi:Asp-tRNA(Asn)/Glu-tRNA(Gln) amidotransferase B subunit